MTKNEKQIEIHGEADWIYFNEPDNKYEDPGEYKVTLKVPRAKSGELIRDINEVICGELKAQNHDIDASADRKKFYLDKAKKPYTVKGDVVEFKLHSKFKPILWDKNRNKLDEKINVWKGSTMWANCKVSGYTKSIGTGATLYLGSAQIDKLVEGAPQNGECPYPKREGSALPHLSEKVPY
jgi:hypothetical protein